jgi:DNA-binding PadR family transcriptional regulator
VGHTVAWDLSPGEWAVLGAVAEGPTHGFAVAQLLAPGGALGRVWTLPRPAFYVVLKKLVQLGLIAERSTERSDRGPVRTILAVTPTGRRAIRQWLEEPVDHVRDIRSMLLLKLAFLDRSHGERRRLIEAQRYRVMAQMEGLEDKRAEAVGFERVLVEWRLSSSRATIEFLDAIGGLVVQD